MGKSQPIRIVLGRIAMIFALLVMGLGIGALRTPTFAVAQDENLSCAGEPIGGGAAAATPAAGATAAAGGMEIDPASLDIKFLPKDTANNYFVTAATGAQEAAAELGGMFEQVGPSGTASAADQVTFIQTLTQQGVAAIAVSANDPSALAPALREARSQGIKVVSYDSDVLPDARDLFVNQADSEQIGRIQIQIMGRLLNCDGQIAILSAASTATNQNAWIEFMQDELGKPGYENMELVDVVYGDDNASLSYDRTVELLTAYPDLKGIISPTTVGIAAAASAIEAEGRSGEVQLTGLGTPNDMRAYVESGTVQEFALWNPVDLGYLTYYAAAALISGQITGAPGETFEAGRLGSYTIQEGSQVILGPPFIFNADNINDFDF